MWSDLAYRFILKYVKIKNMLQTLQSYLELLVFNHWYSHGADLN